MIVQLVYRARNLFYRCVVYKTLYQKRYPLTGWLVVSPFRVCANHRFYRWFRLTLSLERFPDFKEGFLQVSRGIRR